MAGRKIHKLDAAAQQREDVAGDDASCTNLFNGDPDREPERNGDHGDDDGSTATGATADRGSGDAIDPSSLVAGNEGGGRKRRRDAGVKRGRRGKSKAAAASLDSENIAKVLFNIHAMLARLLSMPAIKLTEDEALRFGDAIQQVNAYYDWSAIPEKYFVWGNLVMTAGEIYGGRILGAKTKETLLKFDLKEMN